MRSEAGGLANDAWKRTIKRMELDNRPPYKIRKPLTADEIHSEANKRVSLINKEFAEGFEFIKQFKKSVTFFGSSMLREDSPYYEKAKELAGRLAKKGYVVVTGGGPGIMEAANRGAFEAGGTSVGLNIFLPEEQAPNPYLTHDHIFHYFFSRKVALTYAAEAYIYFPGGYGTLDEFFEIITLMQTERIPKTILVLFGKEFWAPFDEFIKKHLYEKHGVIDEMSTKLYHVCDNEDEIERAILSVPVIDSIPFKGNHGHY